MTTKDSQTSQRSTQTVEGSCGSNLSTDLPFKFSRYGTNDHQHEGGGKMSTKHKKRYSPKFHPHTESRRFLNAAAANDKYTLMQMLDSGTDPSICDSKGRTAMHVAAAKGYDDIVMLLLNHGSDANQLDSLGNTPLHLAACTLNIPTITNLIKAGCKVDATGKSGVSPLKFVAGRLRLLSDDTSIKAESLRTELLQILDLMRSFVQITTIESSDIDAVADRLKNATTSDDLDTVQNMMENIAKLTLS